MNTRQKANQLVFDATVERAKDGRGRAWDDESEKCMYRTSDNNRCFIGALIPDENYGSKLEGNSASHHLVVDALPDDIKNAHPELLVKMQAIHDQANNWDYERFGKVGWTELVNLGNEFHLDTTKAREMVK